GLPDPPSAGGVGVIGADLTIINSGSISGGLGSDGTQADAVMFTGGTNSLTLESGYSFTGDVVGSDGTNTLGLGGSVDDSFAVSSIGPAAEFQGFTEFEKTGTGTWTLTGTTTAVTPWTINQGTLAVSTDANLGDASGGLTFGGGTLEITADGFTSARSVTL